MSASQRLSIAIASALVVLSTLFAGSAFADTVAADRPASNLPATGFDILPVAIVAAALLLIGAMLLLGGRHRRSKLPASQPIEPIDEPST